MLIVVFMILVELKSIASSIVYINSQVQVGNGSFDFPFSSLDQVLNDYMNGTDSDNFFILQSAQNITKEHYFIGNTTIMGMDEIILIFYDSFIVQNNLTLVNLTIMSSTEKKYLISASNFANLLFSNCQITQLNGSSNFTNFIFLDSNANFRIEKTLIFEINNTNLDAIFTINSYALLIISECNFYDINIENTQLVVSNTSFISINITNFQNLYSFGKNSINSLNALFKFFNTKTIFLFCNIYQSLFFSSPFLQIIQEDDPSIIQSLYEVNFESCNFSNITSSFLENIYSFLMISAISYTKLFFQNIIFLDMNTNNSIISVYNCNFSHFSNVKFYNTSANRNLNIINSFYFEILNSSFFNNNLHFISMPLESNLIHLENVQYKLINSILICNCSSYWTTPGIKILSNDDMIKHTIINNSVFRNNIHYYSKDNEAGTVLYVEGDNENIIIENTIFDSNLLMPSIIVDQVGGTCARVMGKYLNLTLYQSIFKSNQALFGSNCIEFDGLQLLVNISYFFNNTNILPVVNKYIVGTSGYGGSIFSIGQNLIVNNSQFNDNFNYYGGNIFLDGNVNRENVYINIDRSNFINNYAHTFGSVLYLSTKVIRMKAYLTNNMIFRNWANYNSAIFLNYFSDGAYVYISFTSFIQNWGDFLPAIDFETQGGTGYINNCLFLNNTASWTARDGNKYVVDTPADHGGGGAVGIFVKGGISQPHVYSENNTFSMNFAVSKGGAIYCLGGNFTDKNSIFSYNVVGTIYIHIGSYLQLINTTIINSMAGDQSCLAVKQFSYLSLIASKFSNIISTEGKGLMNIEEYTNAFIMDCYFENITSKFGSILYARFNGNSLVYFKNNSFFNNVNSKAEEMFYILTSNNIIFEENLIINCSNRAFFVTNSSIILKNNVFKDIYCVSFIQSGCIINVNQYSIVQLYDLNILNINSLGDAVIAYSSDSLITLNNIIISKIYSISNDHFLFISYHTQIFIVNSSFNDFFLGGFYSLNSSLLLFNHSSFSKNNYMNNDISSPILYSENTQYLLIEFSSFFDNFGSQNGSAINLKCSNENSQQNRIYFSNFQRNRGNSNGGAIFINDCPLEINSSIFYNNSAINMGGSIYYEGPYEFNLFNNSFFENNAKEGGAIKYTDSIPNINMNNIFKDNHALYGPNIASYPIRFNIYQLTSNLSLETYKISGRPSTSDSILNLTLSLIDNLNQTIFTLNNEFVEIFLFESNTLQLIKLTGQTKIKIEQGKINIDKIFFYSNITTTNAFFLLNTSLITNIKDINYNISSPNERIENNQYILTIPLTITSCLVGEVFDEKLLTCISCSNNKYSLNPKESSCKICPIEAAYCYSNIISLKKGYWRSNIYSTSIYECQGGVDSCLGGYHSDCAIGYRGPLCQSCLVSDIIYSKSLDNSCEQCSQNKPAILAKLLTGSIFLVMFYILIIYTNLMTIDTLKIHNDTGEISDESKEKFISPIYNKIFMNYLQTISLLKGIDLKWGSDVNDLFQTQFSAGNAPTYIYSFDCLIDKNFPIPAIYLKVILVSITPFIALIILSVFWFIKYKIGKSDILSKFITSELVLLTIFQPMIVSTMSVLFSCQIIDNVQYLSYDLYYECYNYDNNNFYSFYFALISLIIWIILYPLFNFYRLMKARKILKTIKIRRKYGFLYNSYKIDSFYWEFVELYKKYLLIAIINFLQTSLEIKSLIVIIILGITSYKLMVKKPFFNRNINKTAIFAEIVSLSTIYFGLLAFEFEDDTASYISSVSIIIMNIIFLLNFTFIIILVYRKKVLHLFKSSPFLQKSCYRLFYKFINISGKYKDLYSFKKPKILHIKA